MQAIGINPNPLFSTSTFLSEGASSLLSRTEICALLSLEPPELRVTRLDSYRHLVNSTYISSSSSGECYYKAAAYFRDDPFLTRAGAIGEIKSMRTSDPNTVLEACAKEVVTYLINIVTEDTLLEEDAKLQRNKAENLYRRFGVRVGEERNGNDVVMGESGLGSESKMSD